MLEIVVIVGLLLFGTRIPAMWRRVKAARARLEAWKVKNAATSIESLVRVVRGVPARWRSRR